jgi:hypothetical protein
MRLILLAVSVLVLPAVLLSGAEASAAPKKKVPPPVPGATLTPAKSGPSGADAPASTGDASGPAPTRGPTRIDFDDRMIQGQTNKSGSVYLYDRKELKIRSMIKKRESFRDEIVGSLYDS